MIDRRKMRKLPKWCLDKKYKFDQHESDEFSTWRDRSVVTPAEDTDPRMAEDSINPEKPKGIYNEY